jgi:hypothetical protein
MCRYRRSDAAPGCHRVLRLPRRLSFAAAATVLSAVVSVSVNGVAPVAAASTPTSNIRLAVIMFTLPAAASFAVTPDAVRATYFGSGRSVATFYAAASRGALQVTGDVLGPYAVAGDAASCDVGEWAAAARDSAVRAGTDLSRYSHFAYLFPRVSACPWAGLAGIGDNSSYINAPASGDVGLYHAAHELGHDLAADHAHSTRCIADGAAVALADASDCTTTQYGDPFSVMGSGIVRLPSAWERAQMGVLDPAEVVVSDSAVGASFDVAALDGTNPAVHLLLLRRPGGGYLTVEYRTAGGVFDPFAGTSDAGGVFVHVVSDDIERTSSLLDARPATATLSDAYVTPGSQMDDIADGFAVRVTGMDAAAAHIELVAVGHSAASAPAPPAPPASLSGAVDQGSFAQLSWTPAPDATASTRYRVMRAGTVVAVVGSAAFVDTTPIRSTTQYAVQAVNPADVASSPVTVTLLPGDTTAPTAVRKARAVVLSPSSVVVRWRAATDDTGVARYELQFDGQTFFTQRLRMAFRRLTPGTHVVTIAAVDRAGNSAPAVSVTFSL